MKSIVCVIPHGEGIADNPDVIKFCEHVGNVMEAELEKLSHHLTAYGTVMITTELVKDKALGKERVKYTPSFLSAEEAEEQERKRSERKESNEQKP